LKKEGISKQKQVDAHTISPDKLSHAQMATAPRLQQTRPGGWLWPVSLQYCESIKPGGENLAGRRESWNTGQQAKDEAMARAR
jgi:hypothetical protein